MAGDPGQRRTSTGRGNRRLVAGVAAGVGVSLLIGAAQAFATNAIISATLSNSTVATLSDLGVFLQIANLTLSFLVAVLACWIAKRIASGHAAAAVWTFAIMCALSAVRLALSILRLGLAWDSLVAFGFTFILTLCASGLGLLVALRLPPHAQAGEVDTFE